jgi:uncharacterized cofD-like protein
MKRVVAVGGGTGMPVLLRSLLPVVDEASAIVTVADDGGSSGRLRAELNGFPPGDSRNCLVAMADDSVLTQLFQYRFPRGEGLKSHALGNLIISALVEITGDFGAALTAAGQLVGAKGRVMPPSLEPLTLHAQVEPWPHTGRATAAALVTGQCNVANRLRPLRSIGIEPVDAPVNPEAAAAIKAADVIILGPGSLFTSVMANLLVKGIRDAVKVSSARKLFLCNITIQRGETDGYTAVDHFQAVSEFTGIKPDLLISSNTGITRCKQDDKGMPELEPVRVDVANIAGLDVDHIEADLTDEEKPTHHDPSKLTRLWREIL